MSMDSTRWQASVSKIQADSQNLMRRMLALPGSIRPAEVAIKSLGGSLNTTATAAAGLASVGVTAGVAALAKSFVNAASEAENYQKRLGALLGSQAEGNRLAKEMTDYAEDSTSSLQGVMATATNLSGVLKGGVDQITQWIPVIDDLAAAAGLSIQEAGGQVMRMLSAGAGAADLFRERGVNAMLGFTAGVEYSAKESAKKLMEAWESADSKFRGLSGKLADTWAGQVSMMEDKWFIFRNKIMDAGIFDGAKNALKSFNSTLDAGMASLDGFLAAHGEVVSRVTLGAAAVGAAAVSLGAVALGYTALNATLAVTGGIIGLTAGQAGLLGAALAGGAVLAATHWDATRVKFSSLMKGIADATETVSHFFARVVRTGTDAITTLQIGWASFAEVAVSAMGKVATGAQAAALLFKNAWLNAIRGFLVLDEKLTGAMSHIPGFDGLRDGAAELRREIADMDKEIFANAVDRSNLWGSVTPGLQLALDDLKAQKAALRDLMKEPTPAETAFDGLADKASIAADFWAKSTASAATALAQNALTGKSVSDKLSQVTDAAQRATDALFGIGEGADEGSKRAAGALDKLQTRATALRESVVPTAAVRAGLLELQDLSARFPETVDAEAISARIAEIAKNAVDSGLSAFSNIRPALQGVNEDLLRAFDTSRAALGMRELIELTMRELKIMDRLLEESDMGGLDVFEPVAQMIQRVNPGNELVGWAQQIADYQAALGALPAQTLKSIGLELWGQLGDAIERHGTAKVQDLIERIKIIEPSIAKAVDEASRQSATDWASSSSDLSGLAGTAENIGLLGQAVGGLGPEFQTAAQGANVAVDGIKAFMSIANFAVDPVSALINIVTLAGDAMGLFGKEVEKVPTAADRVFEEMANSVEGWVDGMTDAIVDFVKTGEANFKEFVDSVLEDMLRIVIKYALIQPILQAIGVPGSEFAKGGVFNAGNVVPFAKGGAFASGGPVAVDNIIPFARGGVVNKATAFDIGVMGEAGPEAIMPLDRTRDGALGVRAIGANAGAGGGNLNLTVIDQTTRVAEHEYDVQPAMGPDGEKSFRLFIRDAMKQNISDGSLDRDMKSNYGLMRRAR
jgi:hypothetical protein